jgi:hypothetical protein
MRLCITCEAHCFQLDQRLGFEESVLEKVCTQFLLCSFCCCLERHADEPDGSAASDLYVVANLNGSAEHSLLAVYSFDCSSLLSPAIHLDTRRLGRNTTAISSATDVEVCMSLRDVFLNSSQSYREISA